MKGIRVVGLIFMEGDMMNLTCKTACALAVLAASVTSVMAADSVELRVTGVIAPAACTPSLSGGGVLDYGTIGASTLKPTSYNSLQSKVMNLSITCNAPAKVGLNVVAGRLGSLVTAGGYTENDQGFGRGAVQIAGGGAEGLFATGIGFDASGNKIGGMAVNIRNGATTIDGGTIVQTLVGAGGAWKGKLNHFTLVPTENGQIAGYSWGTVGSVDPVAFTTLTSLMNVQAYLNQGSKLDLSQAVNIDGLITFELKYL